MVVVVLEELTPAEEVEREEVPRGVGGSEVPVSVAMPAPVHDRALGRAHEPMEGQEQELPPGRGEPEVDERDDGAEGDAARPRRGDLLERRPLGIVAEEARL